MSTCTWIAVSWPRLTVMNSFICFCSMRFCSSCCSFMLRLYLDVNGCSSIVGLHRIPVHDYVYVLKRRWDEMIER